MTTLDEWRRVTTFWPPEKVPSGLEPLVRHARGQNIGIYIGPGWFDLARACHDAASSEFPDYELLAVKQKYARLEFQVFPRTWTPGGSWTSDEARRLDDLIEPLQERSESICERCGQPGHERDSRPIMLTLCDCCEADVPRA